MTTGMLKGNVQEAYIIQYKGFPGICFFMGNMITTLSACPTHFNYQKTPWCGKNKKGQL